MEHKDFNLDYFTKITFFNSELNFLIQLCLSYISYFEKDIRFIKNNENSTLCLLNRQLKDIDFNIQNINFYLKKFIFTLKKKKEQLTLNYIQNYNINNYICNNCLCLSINFNMSNKIMYYQKFLKLQNLDNNILKFNFIFCNICNNYKISLKADQHILFFSTLDDILKYFIKNKIINNFIIFNNKIQYVNWDNLTNNLFFEDLNFINLNVIPYNLIFFFCYLKGKNKYNFNIKSNIYNNKFNNIYIYLLILLLLNSFFIENYLVIVPEIVKIYDETLQLEKSGHYYNMQIEDLKFYQKKNRIKVTKKIKKERKLFYLNKFFNEFKIQR